jgi:CDP-diacylglycerol---glycerol-3-phosphate 3-phosphatidyltransferase
VTRLRALVGRANRIDTAFPGVLFSRRPEAGPPIMPSVYDLKPRFQALLRPAMHALDRFGASPNAITGAALIGSIAVGGLLLLGPERPGFLLLLPAWLLVRMALNALDGMMARELDKATPLGAVLNEVGDVVSDLALYLPLARLAPGAAVPAVLFAAAAALTEFCGVLGQALGGRRRYDGPMGKSDRALATGIGGVALAMWPEGAAATPWALGALALLCAITCRNRIARTLAELRREVA